MKPNNLIATVSIGALALMACEAPPPAKPKPRDLPPATVQIQTLELDSGKGQLEAVGRVKYKRESTVSARVMGRVIDVRVKSGDTVRKGQVLLRIDDRDARGRVDQARGALTSAKAAAEVAKQMLERFEKLRAQDAASKAKLDKARFDFDNAQGAIIQARGALQTAQAFLKDTVVLSPYSGKVVDTMIEEGEMAAPGYPLVRIEGQSDLEFEATVSARDLGAIHEGMDVEVFLDTTRGEPQKIAGTVTEVVPAADRVTHSNLVRVKLTDTDGVRSGTFGRVRFADVESSCDGMLVAQDRIVRRGQLEAVFVVDETDRVRLRLVRTGRTVGPEIEVLSGLSEGDRLVVSKLSDLVDGQPAKVQ